jgi:hypothetical protein
MRRYLVRPGTVMSISCTELHRCSLNHDQHIVSLLHTHTHTHTHKLGTVCGTDIPSEGLLCLSSPFDCYNVCLMRVNSSETSGFAWSSLSAFGWAFGKTVLLLCSSRCLSLGGCLLVALICPTNMYSPKFGAYAEPAAQHRKPVLKIISNMWLDPFQRA